jgi:hypothetical protein
MKGGETSDAVPQRKESRRALSPKLWRLCKVGTASRIVHLKVDARAYM